VHIPGKSGLDILKEFMARTSSPILMISGQGRIAWRSAPSRAARWIHRKPFRGSEIGRKTRRGDRAYARRQAENSRLESRHCISRTRTAHAARTRGVERSRQALPKEAGSASRDQSRTIEDHRANIMKKLGARNAADLVRIVMTTQRQGQV